MRARTGVASLALLGSALVGAVAAGAPPAQAAQTGGGTTFRASVSSSGVQSTRPTTRARISRDGNHVVYQVRAALAPEDSNGMQDIYWTDLTNPFRPITRRASSTSTGGNGNNDAEFAEISQDGRYVVYATLATNILPGVTGVGVYRRDMTMGNAAGNTRLVSVAATRPVVSDDGRIVSYNTLPAATSDIMVKDLNDNRTLRITTAAATGDTESFRPEISGDGNHIVFASDLKLLPNDTNTGRDVYVANISNWRGGGTTFTLKLVSVGLNGLAVGSSSSRPGINRNGSVVSFQSPSGALVSGDTNGQMDAFVRDYRSNANGVTVAVGYRTNGTIPTNAESSRPQLDDSGNIVTFVSTGGQIVTGDTNNREDAFVRDWKLEQSSGFNTHTYLLGISPTGEPGLCPGIPNVDEGTKDISTRSYLSGDGKVAVFISGQCNLTPPTAFGGPDTNFFADAFVRTFRPVPPDPGTVNYRALDKPVRLLDTRPGAATADGQQAGIGARPAGSVLQLPVAGRAGIPNGTASVVANVTVVGPAAAGFLTVFPCGQTRPIASNINYSRGQTIPNLVLSKLGTGGNAGRMCLYTSAATHLIVDAGGGFASTQTYTPLAAPARLLDTRPGASTIDGQFAGIGLRGARSITPLTVRRAGVPNSAQSVVLNVAALGAAADGFVTVFPCGQAVPTVSNLNYKRGEIIANAVVAKPGANGQVCLFTSAATHLFVDIGGYFPNTVTYIPLAAPARLLDTRPSPTVDGLFSNIGARAAGSTTTLSVGARGGVPSGAGAVVVNVTTVGPLAGGFVTVFPCDQTRPNASNLNFPAGRTIANAVVTKLSAGGVVCLYTSATTHLIVDVAGTLT